MFSLIKDNNNTISLLDNVIVIWQGDEILTALHDIFEQSYIYKWSIYLKDSYDIIFILRLNNTINKYELFYDCFNNCNPLVLKWLYFTLWCKYQENLIDTRRNYQNKHNIILYFIFVCFLCIGTLVFSCLKTKQLRVYRRNTYYRAFDQ